MKQILMDLWYLLHKVSESYGGKVNTWDVLDKINEARGMGSSNQCYNVLYTIARAFNVGVVVEIGTHRGASAIVMAQAITDNGYYPLIHTIDNYKMYKETKREDILLQAIDNINKSGFCKNIHIHDGDSTEVLPRLFEEIGDVDLCFIDGDHSVEGIMKDFHLCEPHTNLIIFHDTLKGDCEYFDTVTEFGYSMLSFPTRYVEGDGHLVGISVAYRKDKRKCSRYDVNGCQFINDLAGIPYKCKGRNTECVGYILEG